MTRQYPSTWSLAPEATCPICGTIFQQLLSDYNRGRIQVYCSKRCMGIGASNSVHNIWSHVDQSGGPDACWLFVGHINTSGYGRFTVNNRYVAAHRAAWEAANGPIPKGVQVLHNCPGGDSPACCNPTHLFTGTHAENMADMASKGRSNAGRDTRHHKLTANDVLVIRECLKRDEFVRAIARRFNVNAKTIRMIRDGETWRDVA
jgi:hypothetical protein